jgi:nitrate reductase (NAD(P)H)
MMRQYHVGRLDEAGRKALQAPEQTDDSTSAKRAVFLAPKKWKKATLDRVTPVSRDTKVFRFKLEHETQVSGLPVGQHLMMRLRDTTTETHVVRAYTPISPATQEGFLDLLVKLYLPSETAPGGRMSMALEKLPLDTAVEFMGPIGGFEYLGNGKMALGGKERNISSFVMICGGSGITPIFQVLRGVMQDAGDKTYCTVLNGNRQEEDILLRDHLDAFSRDNGLQCKVLHVLSRAGSGWEGRRGYISTELIASEATPVSGCMALVCGPPGLVSSVKEALLKCSWKEDDIYVF